MGAEIFQAREFKDVMQMLLLCDENSYLTSCGDSCVKIRDISDLKVHNAHDTSFRLLDLMGFDGGRMLKIFCRLMTSLGQSKTCRGQVTDIFYPLPPPPDTSPFSLPNFHCWVQATSPEL